VAKHTIGGDPLAPEYLEDMHRAALKVIEGIGLEIPRADVREALRKAGVRIEDGRAKLTAREVEEFLDAQRPGWGRGAVTERVRAGPGEPLQAYIPLAYQYHLDPQTDEIMPMTRDLMIEEITFMHAARELGVAVAGTPLGCPVDVPPRLVPLLQYLLGFKYSGQGGYTWIWPEETSRFLFRMLEVTGDRLTQSDLYVLSPLRLGGTEFDFAMDHLQMWESFSIGSHGMTSGNLPAQPIAAFVLSTAETLAAATALWILGEGRPVDFSIFACPLDLGSMQMLYGGPEFHLFQRLEGRVNGFYKGNDNPDAHMFTMEKRPGFQAGSEKTMAATFAALQGARRIVGAGVLSRDEIFSPEEVLLDWEIVCSANRLRRGIDGEDPGEWYAIIEAGVRGGYTATDHTLDHYREIYWQPRFLHRDTLATWRQKGEPRLRDELRSRVREIRSAHEYEPPREQLLELERIYGEAALELA
jgi:trimethylamine:corrinoid methyltransferase-like protein